MVTEPKLEAQPEGGEAVHTRCISQSRHWRVWAQPGVVCCSFFFCHCILNILHIGNYSCASWAYWYVESLPEDSLSFIYLNLPQSLVGVRSPGTGLVQSWNWK